MAAQSDRDQMATQVDWLGDFGGKGSTKCLNHDTMGRTAKGQGVVSPQRKMLNLTQRVRLPKLQKKKSYFSSSYLASRYLPAPKYNGGEWIFSCGAHGNYIQKIQQQMCLSRSNVPLYSTNNSF